MLVTFACVFFLVHLCDAGFERQNRTARASMHCRYKLSHTIESYTKSGMPCMNDCHQGFCLTSLYTCEECTVGTEKAPTYYTSQYKAPNHSQCLSRCGRYGYDYTWCFVDNNLRWDYCNGDTDNRETTVSFTFKHGPCRDECDYYGSSDTWCRTYWFDWGYCSPEKVTYNQVRSIYGNECRGKCEKRDSSWWLWCYVDGKVRQLCAPVAEY